MPQRCTLAVVRLALLFALASYLVLALQLDARTRREDNPLATPPLPPSTAAARQIPFRGINTMLAQADRAAQEAAMARLKADGFGWVRQRFDWHVIEPQPGQYEWAQSDALIAAMARNDLVPVALLDGSPAWARVASDRGAHENPLAPPANFADYAHFAAAFANRYRNQVRFYQIWDEPNLWPHWGQRYIEPVEYAQLLKAAATAIRAADSDAVILTAALAPTADRGHTAIDEVYFLERLYAAGAAPYFDAVAAQGFGFGNTADDSRARNNVLNFQRIRLLRQTMLAAGDGATPIWAVRFGWNTQLASPWRTVTQADQLRFAVRALEIGYDRWPWLAAMGWMIDQPAAPADDPQWGFALTPELAQALHTWQLSIGTRRIITAEVPANQWTMWGLLLAILVVVWRGGAAARILPWHSWSMRYRMLPVAAQAGFWGSAIALYYFAAVPPFILFAWGLLALLCTVQAQAGLGLALLLLPFYFQHKEIHFVSTTITLTASNALALALLPALAIAIASKSPSRGSLGATAHRFVQRLTILDWLAVGWFGISLLAIPSIWQWPAYWQGLGEGVCAPLLLYLAIRLLSDTPVRLRHMAILLCAGGILVAVVGLIDWWQGAGTTVDGLRRLVGPYYSANHAALWLVRTLFLGGGLALAASRWRIAWVIALATVSLALLLTASRGALLLGLPVGSGVLAWFWWRRWMTDSRRRTTDDGRPTTDHRRQTRPEGTRDRRRTMLLVNRSITTSKKLAIGIIAIVVVVGLIGLFVLPSFWLRLTNSATLFSRLQVWQATLALWQDHLGVGVGPGGFFWRYPAYLTAYTPEPNILHPHNVWLEVVATWGLVGLIWLLGLLVATSWTAQRRRLRMQRQWWLTAGLLAALAAGFAHAQVDAFWSLPDLAAWNWLALGLLVCLSRVKGHEL